MSGIEVARTPTEPPDWADILPAFALCTADQLPPGFVSGWCYTAPIIDMPVYLTYLERRLHEAGGTVRSRKVSSLAEGFERANTVINCTGYGARELAHDDALTATRGDLVTVANPGWLCQPQLAPG